MNPQALEAGSSRTKSSHWFRAQPLKRQDVYLRTQ